MIRAIRAELLKIKGSKVPLWTALAVVAYGLISIGVAFAIKSGEMRTSLTEMGDVYADAVALGLYAPTWGNVLRLNVQAIAGAWGAMLCGVVTAYVFGRERKEGTQATMLTSPVERRYFATAKLAVIAVWVLTLALVAFGFQTAAFAVLGFEAFSWERVFISLSQVLTAALLIYLTLPLVGLVSLSGKPGYLRPMLFSLVVWSVGNSLLSTEFAHLYPWAMPTLIAGASWLPIVPDELTTVSWVICAGVFVVGTAAVMWKLGRANDAV